MSTPHCSLIMYVAKDADLVPDLLRDLRSFFGKFPIHYEVIVVVEKGSADSLAALTKEPSPSSGNERLHIHQNRQKMGRARSLHHGLNMAVASALLVINPEMASPLGDIFKMWQHLVSEEETALCRGNRYSKKDSPFRAARTSRARTEHFFNQLLNEQGHQRDSLCEVLAFKKTSWEKISQELNSQKIHGWYLSLALSKCPSLQNLKIVEVPVYDSGVTSRSYSPWRERWNLLQHLSLK